MYLHVVAKITNAQITLRTDMVSQTCSCSGTSAWDSELVKSLKVCVVVGLCPINSIQVIASKLPSGAQNGRGMGWSWTLGDKVYAGVLRLLPRGSLSNYPARLPPYHFALACITMYYGRQIVRLLRWHLQPSRVGSRICALFSCGTWKAIADNIHRRGSPFPWCIFPSPQTFTLGSLSLSHTVDPPVSVEHNASAFLACMAYATTGRASGARYERHRIVAGSVRSSIASHPLDLFGDFGEGGANVELVARCQVRQLIRQTLLQADGGECSQM